MFFNIFYIEFENLVELEKKQGLLKTYNLIDKFANAVREILRDSDILSRSPENKIYMLLPKVTEANSQIIYKRISQHFLKEDLKYKINHFSSQNKKLGNVTIEDIFTGLNE